MRRRLHGPAAPCPHHRLGRLGRRSPSRVHGPMLALFPPKLRECKTAENPSLESRRAMAAPHARSRRCRSFWHVACPTRGPFSSTVQREAHSFDARKMKRPLVWRRETHVLMSRARASASAYSINAWPVPLPRASAVTTISSICKYAPRASVWTGLIPMTPTSSLSLNAPTSS